MKKRRITQRKTVRKNKPVSKKRAAPARKVVTRKIARAKKVVRAKRSASPARKVTRREARPAAKTLLAKKASAQARRVLERKAQAAKAAAERKFPPLPPLKPLPKVLPPVAPRPVAPTHARPRPGARRPGHATRTNNASPVPAHRQVLRVARNVQFNYMKAPGIADAFDVGDTVEVFCDHERDGERVRGWIKGIVVQVDNKLVAVQFRSNVFLTDGWMVPDRILWYSLTSDQIRPATFAKRGSHKVIPDY